MFDFPLSNADSSQNGFATMATEKNPLRQAESMEKQLLQPDKRRGLGVICFN